MGQVARLRDVLLVGEHEQADGRKTSSMLSGVLPDWRLAVMKGKPAVAAQVRSSSRVVMEIGSESSSYAGSYQVSVTSQTE